jgi:flagella basal body P-ring formation protein FlgA
MKAISTGLVLLCLIGTEATAESRIVETVRDYIVDRFDLDEESITIEMRDNRSFDCLLSTDSLKAYSTSSTPPRGSYPVKFDIIRDGITVKTISTSVRVALWADSWVARKRIKRGETVDIGNLFVERRDVTRHFGKLVQAAHSFSDIRAKRTINAGSVIVSDMVEPIPMVSRGEEVLIRCDVGNMEITTTGIAKENGLQGDRIEVANKSTKRRITAEVESPGVVYVTR